MNLSSFSLMRKRRLQGSGWRENQAENWQSDMACNLFLFNNSHVPLSHCIPRTNAGAMIRAILLFIFLAFVSLALAFSGEFAKTADDRQSRGEEEPDGFASAAFITRAAHEEAVHRHTDTGLRRTSVYFATIHQSIAVPVFGRRNCRENVASISARHLDDIPLFLCSLLI